MMGDDEGGVGRKEDGGCETDVCKVRGFSNPTKRMVELMRSRVL
jgi:hypothetical protein